MQPAAERARAGHDTVVSLRMNLSSSMCVVADESSAAGRDVRRGDGTRQEARGTEMGARSCAMG